MSSTVILLVDDEKSVLTGLKQQLRHTFGTRFGYETAENVEEAWEVIGELTSDDVEIVVVVSDWLMPDTKGDVFLAELRGRYPRIGRIMLTGQADPAAIERARGEADVTGVFSKPWKIEELAAAIEAALPG